MPRENPTRTPTGILTFLGGLLLLVIFAVLVVQWVRSTGTVDEIAAKRATGRKATREQLAVKHQEQIQSTAWADKAKGVARIPIADAMALTMVELKAKKPMASSVKVDAPLPVIPPDPNSTEPPPLALPSAPGGALTVHFEPLVDASKATQPMAPAAPAAAPLPDVPIPGAAPVPTSSQPSASVTSQPLTVPANPSVPGTPLPPSGGNGSPAVVPGSGATLPAGTAPPMNANGAIPAAQATPGSEAPKPTQESNPSAPAAGDKPATPPQAPRATSPAPTVVSPSATPGEPVAPPAPVPATPASAPAPSASQAAPAPAEPAAAPSTPAPAAP